MHIAAGLSGEATELLLNYQGNPNVRYLENLQFYTLSKYTVLINGSFNKTDWRFLLLLTFLDICEFPTLEYMYSVHEGNKVRRINTKT